MITSELSITAQIAEISSQETLNIVQRTLQDEINDRALRAQALKIRVELACSPLTLAECTGKMLRLNAEVEMLVHLRDKVLPAFTRSVPAAIAETVAERFGTDE